MWLVENIKTKEKNGLHEEDFCFPLEYTMAAVHLG